jgi:hypothetical protein
MTEAVTSYREAIKEGGLELLAKRVIRNSLQRELSADLHLIVRKFLISARRA